MRGYEKFILRKKNFSYVNRCYISNVSTPLYYDVQKTAKITMKVTKLLVGVCSLFAICILIDFHLSIHRFNQLEISKCLQRKNKDVDA